MVGAEQSIEERKMDGEVDVHRFLVRGVMPVVIAHRHEVSLQPVRIRAEIGVAERGVEGDEHEVARQHALREAAHHHRNHDQAARDDDVDEVGPRAGDPVEGLDRMMDRVEAPQEGDRVERSVHDILPQVRDEDRRDELHEVRPALDERLERRDGQPFGQQQGRQHHEESEQLRGQMGGHEIKCVSGPFRPERLLPAMQRPEPFHRDEDDGHHEQVEQEPVEADAVV